MFWLSTMPLLLNRVARVFFRSECERMDLTGIVPMHTQSQLLAP